MYDHSPLQMAATQERCPVCRLFLLPNMLLSEHLDTHPKDQVILALTNLLEKHNRCMSPWAGLAKTSSESNKPEWTDFSGKTSTAKLKDELWLSPNIRSTVLASPKTTYVQMQQNSSCANDIRFNTSLNYACATNNTQSTNTQPVISKIISHENMQKNYTLSTSTPVIQRIDNMTSIINEDKLQSSPSIIHTRTNYLEQYKVNNKYNAINESAETIETNLEFQTKSSEKSLVSETIEINGIHNICLNDEINRLRSININSNKTLRRDIIIQPAKTKLNAVDTTPISVFDENNELLNSVNSNSTVHSFNVHNNSLNANVDLSKQNIEILSHSVINNSKYFKNPDVKSFLVKQKKNKIKTQNEKTMLNSANTYDKTESCSLHKSESFQRWNDQENSEEKLINDDINEEKSYDTILNQDNNFEIESRTRFSPNLVIINLETNKEKNSSPKNLIDFDTYQPELKKQTTCNQHKKFSDDDASSEFQQQTGNKETASREMKFEVYQNQNITPNDVSSEEFSSNAVPKLISPENFRQNLECSLSSESLNIRTDEKMPARGELSEQESTDSSSWAYQNACSSFPLNLPSNENDLNLSQYLSPMLEPSSSCSIANQIDSSRSSKSSSTFKQQNIFRCVHCSEEFVCAKERRVHMSRCHLGLSTAGYIKDHNEPVRNSYEPTQSYYISNPSNQLDHINISDKVNIEVITQTKCDNFDSSLLVSSMNIINNADMGLESLENMRLEIKNADFKSDINLFNLNQQDNFNESNVKIENISSQQSTSKKIIRRVPKKKKTIYTCIFCQEEFKTITSFNLHLKKHPLKCRICFKLFTRKQTFDNHELKHMGNRKHVCQHCSKCFFSEQKLKKHDCKTSVLQEYKCLTCDLKFHRRKALVQHKISMHKIKPSEKMYFCQKCGENFPSFAKLYYHKETHDTKPKNCKYCTQKFTHLISLNRHIRTSHNDKTIENSETCQICNKSLSKYSLRGHMKLHVGNAIYNCFICNKNFSTKWNLKQHRFVHQNRSTKPFKCQICPSAFIRLQDYNYHMNSHKKLYSFVCNQCGRKFIRKYNYLRHVKEHSQEKKHQCTVTGCTKIFHRKYYLTEHMRTHTGSRPFVCTICSKTTATKSNHNKHLKIHHANTRDSINVEN